MTMIKYTGTSDSYELSAADFAKGGVEGARKTRFPKGKAVEVDDAIAELLLNADKDDPVFGDFKTVFQEADDEDEAYEDDAPKGSANPPEMSDSGNPSQSSTSTPPAKKATAKKTTSTTSTT